MEKTVATGLKKGSITEIESTLWQVMTAERNFRGRGSGSVKCKLKNLKTGATVVKNFRSDEVLPLIDTETLQLEYLYKDTDALHFMSPDTYEQYEIASEIVGDFAQYLKEGQLVHVVIYNGTPITMIPPKSVQLVVTEAEDAVKGDTSGTARKPAIMETGATVMVPLFIKKGETIVIHPETGEYVERA